MYRRGINWQARATAVLAMLTLDKAHLVFFGSPENTQLGVTIYQGTAALCNGLSVMYFAHGLQAKVSYDLQRLAFCAMFLNAAAWLLYMAQQSPSTVNFLIGMVTYGMLIRTIWISDGDSDSGGWSDLVHRLLNRGWIVHHEKAKQ